jgi:hypothetical protein
MNRALTKRDLVATTVILTVWAVLFYVMYLYPTTYQGRIAAGLFFISFFGLLLPRWVFLAIYLWKKFKRSMTSGRQ